jgi:Pyridine nucleotide-disulphide oxidoreductase
MWSSQLQLRSLTLLVSVLPIRSFLLPPLGASANLHRPMSSSSSSSWKADDPQHVQDAKSRLEVWPLDEYNVKLLNEVHPRDYVASTTTPHEIYDLIAIGAGAGGLVSSKQSARRGAKSAMITEKLAGGDCLNVGCVPSKGTTSSSLFQYSVVGFLGLISPFSMPFCLFYYFCLQR